jgi:hypothetical protein
MPDERKDAFVRWQGITIQQLSFRDKAEQLGKRTWCLLKLQLLFFGFGAILIPPLAILRVID